MRVDPDDWRYPGERPMFFFTLAILLLIVLVAIPFTLGGVLVVAALGFVIAVVRVSLLTRQVRKRGVAAAQDRRLGKIVEGCRARLGMGEDVEVYRVGGAQRNAFAVGLSRPYAVAVFSGLCEVLDDDELAFVVGHELGHVRFRHTRALALTGHLGQGTGGTLTAIVRHLLLLGWSRSAEYSADRAGLVACGRLDAALSALFKVGLHPAQLARADLPALVRSAVDHYQREDVSFAAGLRSLARTHPALEQRLDHLVDFASSPEGRAALSDASSE